MPRCAPMPPPPPPNSNGSSKPAPSRWASPRSWPFPKPCPACSPTPGSHWSAIPTSSPACAPDPDLLPGAVEELLRYAGIVRRVFRRATANVDLGGVTHRAGRTRRADAGLGESRPGTVSRPRPARPGAPRHQSRRARDRPQFLRRRHAHPHGGFGGHRRAGVDSSRQYSSSGVGEWRTGLRVLFSGVGVRDLHR